MYKYIIWLCLAASCFGQDKLEHTITQATFLEAKAATIYQLDEGVQIQVEGLTPESKQGLIVSIKGLTDTEIEITTLIEFQGLTVGLYPPQFKSPNEDGNYVILGEPGQRFGIRGRTEDGIKQIFAEISGTPTPAPDLPTDPPPSLDAVTKIVNTALDELDDPVTASYIRKELVSIQFTDNLENDIKATKAAIGKGLLEAAKVVKPPYKDWEGKFRIPLDKAISPKTSTELQAIVKAIVDAIPESQSVSKIIMLTREDCEYCKKWEREVEPLLKGWEIDKRLHNGDVPSFLVCVDGVCSPPYIGYMSVTDFNAIVRSLRNFK